MLQKQASRVVKFVAIPDADHFSVLAPATEMLARAILADTGPKVSITPSLTSSSEAPLARWRPTKLWRVASYQVIVGRCTSYPRSGSGERRRLLTPDS